MKDEITYKDVKKVNVDKLEDAVKEDIEWGLFSN